MVGDNYYSSFINNCFATGNVFGKYENAGGLVGRNSTNTYISYSYATGSVTGVSNVGGLLGYNQNYSNAYVIYCYATGNVHGSSANIGGLMGVNGADCTLRYCYATGNVVSKNYFRGGFLGLSAGTIENCYWNIETSGQVNGVESGNNANITGLTTAQIKKSSNITNLGSFSTIWKIRNDSTYAALRGVSDNAPFAFRDEESASGRFLLKNLLNNDFDYETKQANLVLKVDTIYGSGNTDLVTWFSFFPETVVGHKDSLLYRVGEVRTTHGDTLWGNRAVATFLKILNTAPLALNDTVFTNEDESVDVTPLSNDTDLENDPLLIDSIAKAEHGTYNCSGYLITYTPQKNWNGTEKLMYIISDGEYTDTAYIIITVAPVNDVPVITSTAPNTAKANAEYTYVVTATDADGDALSYTLSNQPVGMEINSNVITWTPGEGIASSGAVKVNVSDGVLSDSETFTISVNEVVKVSLPVIPKVNIYSNPVTNLLHISNAAGNILKMYDMQGKEILVKSLQTDEETIDVSELRTGIYLVKTCNQQVKIMKR